MPSFTHSLPLASLLIGLAATAVAQQYDYGSPSFGPAATPPDGPSYRHASTFYEGARTGESRYIDAAGRYNFNTAVAARHAQAAYAQALENDRARVVNYFVKRAINQQFTRKPRPTAAEVREVTLSKRPQRLDENQLDRVAGNIKWPSGLKLVSTPAERAEIERLFAAGNYEDSGRGTANHAAIASCLNVLRQRLADHANQMHAEQHVAAVNFVESLQFEALLVAEIQG